MSEFTSVCLPTWKTELWLSVRAAPTQTLTTWLTSLLHDEVSRLDVLASRFRSDSELSSVNRGHGTWVDVSWDFVTVLTASLYAARATGGLVDPTLGRHIVAAGYDKWAEQDSGVETRTGAGDWRGIEIRPGAGGGRVRIPADTALDLGSIAKAWLADRLARTVHRSTGFDTAANMGGDIRVVSPGQPWTVWADPDLNGVPACGLDVHDAGLATSGVGHRSWDGGHHIIDPRNGQPADTNWWSVSVLAADAAGANAASTASVILGAQGPAWLSRMGLDGWFVAEHDSIHVGTWPHTTEEAA